MSEERVFMSEEEKTRIRQICSGHYLCEAWPDDWEDMDGEDQDQFMEDHAWQPFEYWPISEVYSVIDSAASMMISYIENNYLNGEK